MNFSSRLKHKISALVFLTMALSVACTKPDKGESTGTDFTVTEFKSRSEVKTVTTTEGWNIPKIATYTFTACLTDRATQKKIMGHKFQVLTEKDESIETLSSSDANGCVSWVESIVFNFFAPNTMYVTKERTIRGSGVYSGDRTVVFAINPWTLGEQARDKGDAMVLLNDGAKEVDRLPEDKVASSKNSDLVLSGDFRRTTPMADGQVEGAPRIWVNEVNLKSTKRRSLPDGYALDVLLRLNPVMKITDSDGNILTRSLSQGSFNVTAHLVVTDTGPNEDEKLILTDFVEYNAQTGRLDMGELAILLRTHMIKRAHNGNVTLALILTPNGVDRYVQPFQGLFELGNLNSLAGNSSARVMPTCLHPTDTVDKESEQSTSARPCQNVSQFIKSASLFDDLKKAGFASNNEPFLFDLLRLRFISVLAGETATQRTVLYSASTCITDRHDGSKVADIPFKIEYLDVSGQVITDQVFHRTTLPEIDPNVKRTKAEEKAFYEQRAKDEEIIKKENMYGPHALGKTTDSSGCLKWNAKIAHKYYDPEQFYWQRVRITRVIEGKQVDKEIEFALNPWDDKFTFGWDKKEFTPFEGKKAKSRFFMSSYNYHTVRFLYNIDPFLELEVKKTVLFDLQPRVLRYSGIINARKQTEPVRDGIYLLKVAIQKDFLDPTERNLDLKTATRVSDSLGKVEVPSVINESLGEVNPREYITTDTSLVRVVDGHLIHPLELTMRDLRLMRVRSNFLIQLQTVDERLIQNHDVINNLMKEDLNALKENRLLQEKRRQNLAPPESLDADLAEKFQEQADLALKTEIQAIRGKYQGAFFSLKEQLESMPFINNNFEADPSILKPIKEVLKVNDFTDVKLPNKESANLDIFLEKNSGLETRTFVGPVIFLSNAYSDSVRATDNLDEAECSLIKNSSQKQLIEEDEKELLEFGFGQSLLADTVGSDEIESVVGSRQNKAYRFSRYYGALTHLCNTQVDDLIAKEKIYEADYRDIMPLAASKANFLRTNGLDYVSLVNEPLETLYPDDCDKDYACSRMRSRVLSKQDVQKMLNRNFESRQSLMGHNGGQGIVYGRGLPSLEEALLPELDIKHLRGSSENLLYKRDIVERSDAFTNCSVLSDLLVDRLTLIAKDPKLSGHMPKLSSKFLDNPVRGANSIFSACVARHENSGDAVILDEKIKVYDTGPDYVFRGGLQMNFNVGRGTSFGRSDSWGGSIGLEDVPAALKTGVAGAGAAIGFMAGGPVGGAAGAAIGLGAGLAVDLAMKVIKPLSLKVSKSDGSSDGTNVTAGTYLVSQVAKFDVPIASFERCRVVRFTKDFGVELANNIGVPEQLSEIVSKGLMICGGRVSSKDGSALIKVPETYFYFTQHFTEGDMLDQADLYNHPWLLSMRGLRDFGTFVEQINAQEIPSLGGFWSGLFETQSNPSAWPLDHMANTYRNLTPSFPGFYTLSTANEMITNYPLQGRLTKFETDINAEVKCTMEKTNSPFPTCVEKMVK